MIKCCPLRDDEPFKPPMAQRPGDAGLDLTVSRYVFISPGTDAHLSTNVAAELPSGCFGLILPRSSTLVRKGLHVSPGVIDNGYRGEVMILVRNMTQNGIVINPGERVAQLLVLPLWRGPVTVVDRLSAGSRGSDGFGSTGA